MHSCSIESLITGFFLFSPFFGLVRWLVVSLFIEPMSLIVKAQSLHHWTARRFPIYFLIVEFLELKKKKSSG